MTGAMVETMIGKWKMESSENFDEYMKALGKYGHEQKMLTGRYITIVGYREEDEYLQPWCRVKRKMHRKVGTFFEGRGNCSEIRG